MNKKILILLISVVIVENLHQQNTDNTYCNPNKNQYYDQIDKVCKKCPRGSPRYNPQYKMCECCPNNTIWNQSYSACICPKDKPVLNNLLHTCKSCPKGLQFDAQQNQCYHCPEGFKRGPGDSCVPMYE